MSRMNDLDPHKDRQIKVRVHIIVRGKVQEFISDRMLNAFAMDTE